jgi:predicted transcriptional regulator
MKKKENEQKEARRLRGLGLSLFKIAKKLRVSKSSVSLWVRDVKLTEDHKRTLENNRLNAGIDKLLVQSRINKTKAQERRLGYRKNGFERAKTDEPFRLICALYWGEGSKGRNIFSFANSDLPMIKVVGEWVDENVKNKSCKIRVCYYGENGLSEYQIRRRWIKEFPKLKNKKWTLLCSKNKIRRDTQRKGIGKLPYGTGTLYVCSTELVQNVYGGIDYIRTKTLA